MNDKVAEARQRRLQRQADKESQSRSHLRHNLIAAAIVLLVAVIAAVAWHLFAPGPLGERWAAAKALAADASTAIRANDLDQGLALYEHCFTTAYALAKEAHPGRQDSFAISSWDDNLSYQLLDDAAYCALRHAISDHTSLKQRLISVYDFYRLDELWTEALPKARQTIVLEDLAAGTRSANSALLISVAAEDEHHRLLTNCGHAEHTIATQLRTALPDIALVRSSELASHDALHLKQDMRGIKLILMARAEEFIDPDNNHSESVVTAITAQVLVDMPGITQPSDIVIHAHESGTINWTTTNGFIDGDDPRDAAHDDLIRHLEGITWVADAEQVRQAVLQ